MKLNKVLSLTALSTSLMGCANDTPSFSLLSDTNVFNQGTVLNNKMDILWVIDNSGSMQPAQTNLANNFNSFIQSFSAKGYDYRMGVTTTDSWAALFGNANLARLKDGTDATSHTGVFVIKPNTPNLFPTFATNITQGINGIGDERAFQSFKTALSSTLNSDFRRSDAYLSVIIVSDEDDFSHNGSFSLNKNYASAALHTVQSYVTYLDTLTQSSGATRKYSVSGIAVWDQACKNASHAAASIATRYAALVDATGGVKGSICDNFATVLNQIQNKIAELSTQFFLNRTPVVTSIAVSVNGSAVPQDAANGWTYEASSNSVIFHGTAIPVQGSSVAITFDPTTIK
ncbi:MAG: hypothetical protein AB7F59_10900 [Bdellovibrionales bacterium]